METSILVMLLGTTVPAKFVGTTLPGEFVKTTVFAKFVETPVSLCFVGTLVPTIFFVPTSIVGTGVPNDLSGQTTIVNSAPGGGGYYPQCSIIFPGGNA